MDFRNSVDIFFAKFAQQTKCIKTIIVSFYNIFKQRFYGLLSVNSGSFLNSTGRK